MSLADSVGMLQVWWDDGVRSAGGHLALDEAMVGRVESPTLRFYQWPGAPWTLGYFQRWSEVSASISAAAGSSDRAELDIARRWTGGGLVCHRDDFPYSLVVPPEYPLAKVSATESYRWIHEKLAQALRQALAIAVQTSPSPVPVAAEVSAGVGPQVCFSAPVHWDLVEDQAVGQGRKISGAAQRRSRGWLVHQGSVILPEHSAELAGRWRQRFAELLAGSGSPSPWTPPQELPGRATQLAGERYLTKAWLERF